jgi:hypothetical protein
MRKLILWPISLIFFVSLTAAQSHALPQGSLAFVDVAAGAFITALSFVGVQIFPAVEDDAIQIECPPQSVASCCLAPSDCRLAEPGELCDATENTKCESSDGEVPAERTLISEAGLTYRLMRALSYAGVFCGVGFMSVAVKETCAKHH